MDYTYTSSSGSFLSAFLAIHWNAASTLNPSFADVSKYGMFPFEAHHAFAFFSETYNASRKILMSKQFSRSIYPRSEKNNPHSGEVNSNNHDKSKTAYHSTVSTINIDLVPQYNKRKVLRIGRTSLNIKNKKPLVRINIYVVIGS